MPTRLPPLATVLDLLPDAVCVVDPQGRCLFVSAAFERIFGYSAEEMLGRPMIELVHPDDRERTVQAAERIMEGQLQRHFQNRYLHKDGRVVDIQWSARWSPGDQVRIAVAHDITELKRAEAVQAALLAISEAAQAEGDLAALCSRIRQIIGVLLPATNCFVALHDPRRGLVEYPFWVDEHDPPPAPVPLSATTLSNEVIRSGHSLLINPETQSTLPPHLRAVAGKAALDWLGVPLTTANGVIGALAVQSYNSDVRYSAGDRQLLEFVSAQIAAAIERRRNRARLEHLVAHDPLTDLANRRGFHEHLEQALADMRHGGPALALLYLDLDGFKGVNDRHGHHGGDQLLREVGRRIRRCVRQSDLVARLGGDEFAVLLPGMADGVQARTVAEQIRSELARPYRLDGREARVTASIGIAVCPQDATEKKPLLRHADSAMYAAKHRGGNQLAFAGIDPANRSHHA